MKNTFSSLRRHHSAPDLLILEAPPAAPQATGATSVPNNDSSAARIWGNLKHHHPAQPLEYFSAGEVPWNDSGVQCVRNASCLRVQTGTDQQSRVPMHAHVLPSSENAPAESIRYAAAQAPTDSQDAWTRTMIHALQSGQGIFQFVSPQAHRHAVLPQLPTNIRRKHPSILDALLLRMSSGDGNKNRHLGDCFALTKVTPIVTEGGSVDHVQYLIEAEELHSTTLPRQKYSTVLTQAGLPFAHAVLAPDTIVRASALLDVHQDKTANITSDRTPVQDASQLIVSHAGIGRNATLIVYRDIVSKIDTGIVNRDNLDDTLYRLIAAYRAIRGPRFIHSEPQLAAIRAALWLHCPATPKPSLGDRARQLFSVRQSAARPGVSMEAPTDTTASPANLPRYDTTLKGSRSMPSTPTGWRAQPLTLPNFAVAPTADTPALPDGFKQETDSDGNYRFHDAIEADGQIANNGHYSNFWQDKPVTIGGNEYRTVEHYFQAQKYAPQRGALRHVAHIRKQIRKQIVAAATAGETKGIAWNPKNKSYAMPDERWAVRRIGVMYEAVYAKFTQDANLKEMLLATKDAQLIETMPEKRYDRFWGVKDGTGTNMLGQILMQVRKDLRENRGLNPNPNFDPNLARNWGKRK